MKVHTEEKNNVYIISPREKRLDSRNALEFKNILLKLIHKEKKLRILIDMKAIDFIDSAGLGAIVSALKNIGKNGELKIVHPRLQVKDMFELTRLNLVFNIFDDLDASIRSFN